MTTQLIIQPQPDTTLKIQGDNGAGVVAIQDASAGVLILSQSILKGDKGDTGEAMTENSTFTTDPTAYYILAKT